jgi:hypothetical protein
MPELDVPGHGASWYITFSSTSRLFEVCIHHHFGNDLAQIMCKFVNSFHSEHDLLTQGLVVIIIQAYVNCVISLNYDHKQTSFHIDMTY